ncbi:unnamed protein product [Prunus brigantina]
MTFGKVLVLKEVRHVPDVRRNLISGSSLVQQGYKVVLESNMVVITKNNVFIGKGFISEGLFKLNVYSKVIHPKVFNMESSNVWHGSYIVKDNTTTPYEIWKKRAPNLQVLKVWGCLVKVTIPEPKRKKIGPKTVDSVFLGYAHNSSANRFLVINSEISEISNNTILESRDATYFEDIFPFKTRIQKQVVDRSRSNNGSDKASTITSLPVVNEVKPLAEPRRSKRPRVEKSFGDDFYTFLVEGDPTTYREAMISIDAPFWKKAINSEVESILQNNTWELTDLPPGTTPIGCKWVFRKKLKLDGSIDKYKARLVAKGFTQKKGIDYFDIYSPVSRITTIRTLIALTSIHNLVVHQMDVKTAFLNGDLDEEVYMEQPEGFIVKGQEHKVCKLTWLNHYMDLSKLLSSGMKSLTKSF